MISARSLQTADRSRPHRKHGVKLVHHVNIIETVVPLPAPTDIFKISEAFALSIKIIGRKPRILQQQSAFFNLMRR